MMTMIVVCMYECVNNTQHKNLMLNTEASCVRDEVVQEKLVT